MKLKLKQGGIVKLQTAGTTMPNINETILRTGDKQSEAERKEAERQMKLAEQQRMYNRLHGLPENTVFIPTNGGTISETGPLYSNGLERYLDQTAKGQEMVRMADTAKKGAGIALAAAGGNWLMNGLKVAPLLTGLEFVGGGAAGAALKPVGDGMDKTFHTKNQILDFGTALPFVGMIGGAKGAKWLGENKTFRGAIEGFNQRVNSGIQTPVIIDPKVQSTVDHLYREYPDLSLIGDRGQYSEYYKTIFPTSKIKEPLAHGTNDDLILGLEGTVKSGSNSGAPEIQGKNLFFTHVQPYAGLQYSRGLNALPGQNGNRQYGVLKEINGKPYYAPEYAGPQNTSGRTTPMTKLREEIPNKAGEFDRVRLPDGSYTDGHGKLLTEYKAEFGMPEASDKEFLEALGAKEGETFDQFVSRNKEVFKDIYNSGNYKGLYHVKINSENPLIVEGRDTYYDKNGIGDQMTAGRHDAVVQKNAQNEFGTDVVFTEASPERVRILGSLPDRQAFSNNHVLGLSSSKTQPEAATTFHFDGTMPLSRPISEAERLGIPKGERMMFDGDQIEALRPRFNKGAEYYGYDQIPESAGLEDTVDMIKNTFKRHNTFFRGVHSPGSPEDIAHIESLFGKDYNLDDVYKYVAIHGRPGDNAVFVSPLSNAGIYGSTGKTAIVRRKFKLGRNPKNGLNDADFDIMFGGSPDAIRKAQLKGTLTFPGNERGHGIVENELLAPDGTINFIDFVPQNASTSYFDLNGSLNKYLGNKSFHDVYGFGDYNSFTDVPVEKPKFKQGGILKAQNGSFEDFGNTLPQNQQDSIDFNVHRYGELNGKPNNFKEAVKRGMYKKEKDGYHANSIAFNEETGEYEFMKSPNHPTIKYELDGFNSDKAKKFRNKYQLDSTSIPGKYVPKEKQGGILKGQNEKINK